MLETYRELLLHDFVKIVDAFRSDRSRTDFYKHSGYLIDKFAIHAGTLHHVTHGFIERQVGSKIGFGFDIFSFYSVFRVIFETYLTYNTVFASHPSEEVQYLRFLLWRLKSSLSTLEFKHKTESGEKLYQNSIRDIAYLCDEIESLPIIRSMPASEVEKIYNREKKHVKWMFTIIEEKVYGYKNILDLIDHIFNGESFYNLYKYASMYTHSSYYIINQFEEIRGKIITDEHYNPILRHAVFLHHFLIMDLVKLSPNARKEFARFPEHKQKEIQENSLCFRWGFQL